MRRARSAPPVRMHVKLDVNFPMDSEYKRMNVLRPALNYGNLTSTSKSCQLAHGEPVCCHNKGTFTTSVVDTKAQEVKFLVIFPKNPNRLHTVRARRRSRIDSNGISLMSKCAGGPTVRALGIRASTTSGSARRASWRCGSGAPSEAGSLEG